MTIDTPKDDPREADKKRWDFYTSAPLRSADAVCKALPMSEDHYRGSVGYNQRDARAYFLYGAMDEIFKVSLCSIRWSQFVDEPEEKIREFEADQDVAGRHMRRMVLESVIDEQEMWGRKLNELLADLILFESTNEQDYYRIYLGCRWLDAYLGLQRDFEEFFACRSGNADSTIGLVVSQIEEAQTRIDAAKLWFLNGPVDPKSLPRPGRLFRSAQYRFKRALEVATPPQRLALGVSYEMGHSVPSRSIHVNVGGPTRQTERGLIDHNIGRLSVLATHATLVAHQLLGLEPTGMAKTLVDAIAGSDASKILRTIHQSDLEIGDIVTAYGPDVCEIIAKAKSKYGYTAYKVKFLLRPMLPELPEDWYPARYVHLLMSRRSLRAGMVKALESVGASPEEIQKMKEIPDADISKLLPDTFAQLEKDGLLQLMFRRASS